MSKETVLLRRVRMPMVLSIIYLTSRAHVLECIFMGFAAWWLYTAVFVKNPS